MSVDERLARWGIREVFDDRRGCLIETTVVDVALRGTARGSVTLLKRRASFTVDCLDCGPSEHVSPDDANVAVCLRCGRDRWL
jgi:hypothetical protein